MDLKEVEAYFSTRLPAIDSSITKVAVIAVERMARGVSRETWHVETELTRDGIAAPRGFTIRCDHPGGVSVDPVTLRFEYEVYSRLANSPVSVARALWFDEKGIEAVLERPLYVRERVEGDWQVPHFLDPDPRWDELRIEISKEHLRNLAIVHTCDYRGLGFAEIMGVPPSAGAAAETVLRHHENRLRDMLDRPSLLVDRALRRLHATVPTAVSNVGLCKGTNGLGEEIFRDGRIVAMSDWELSLIGDPAYDWAQIQHFVPAVHRNGRQIWGEEHALAYYESVSGIHIEPTTIDWYRNLNSIIKFTYTTNSARALRAGRNKNVRLAWTATEVYYRSQLGLAAIAAEEAP